MTTALNSLFKDRPEVLTAPQVAELLGMTKQGIYHWLRDGVIRGYKVGTTWFILRDDLKETLLSGSNVELRRSFVAARNDSEE
jgi:excisionase family DNA binding protein